MKNQKFNPMVLWMGQKILNFLKVKEGVSFDRVEEEGNTTSALFTDAFGFIYEVRVRQIGKAQDSVGFVTHQAVAKYPDQMSGEFVKVQN